MKKFKILTNHEVLSIVLIMLLALSMSYLLWYGVIYVLFWSLGPTIFGLTFSYKVVIGAWLSFILINSLIKRK